MTALGYQALMRCTTGDSNTAIGDNVLSATVTGNYNTGVGSASLINNTSSWNTALGYHTGYRITSGWSNVFIGYNTGSSVTTGDDNVYIGNGITGASADSHQVNIGTVILADSSKMTLRLPGTTISTLGAASGYTAGAMAFVTDSSTSTPGATATTGGANKVYVFTNGTNWVVF